jgi:PhnB protein
MEQTSTFIPVLAISSGVMDIGFYEKAFGAITLWRLNNDDGSVHVAALSINGAMFRMHEESREPKGDANLSPTKAGGTTVTIALRADDVHALMARAIAAGAREVSPVTDYEYGYRQGEIIDPFGHRWLIEKVISEQAFANFMKSVG